MRNPRGDGELVEYGETLLIVVRGEPGVEHPPHPDRQPRRDRRAHHPHLPAAGYRNGAGRFRGGSRLAAGAPWLTRVVCIGPAHPATSYLSVEALVQAALGTGCDAIHPGYGFLSERAAFARLCEAAGTHLHRPDCRNRSMRSATSCARAVAQRGRRAGGPGWRGALAAEAARELGEQHWRAAAGQGGRAAAAGAA